MPRKAPAAPGRTAARATTLSMALAGQFKSVRTALGWSQRDLAARAGVSVQSVACVETGRRALTLAMADKFAAALGVHVATVLLAGPCGTCMETANPTGLPRAKEVPR